MSPSDDPARPARAASPHVRPWVAVLLSLACTGLGHLYAGAERRGLAFFLLSLLFVPAAALAAVLPASTGALALLVVALLLAAATSLIALMDAARVARRARTTTVTRVLWRPGLVALFLTVSLAFPLGAAVVLRTWCLEAFKVASGSMEPSFPGGDRILVDKRAYVTGAARRGDVVVFRRPTDGGRAFIKRVIGLPGDRIEISGGQVLVNGRPLPLTPAPDVGPDAFWEGEGRERHLVRNDPAAAPVPRPLPDMPPTLLGPDQVFVLGDHRGSSLDSRTFGPVPLENVVGPATYVLWPLSRFGPIRAAGAR